MQKKLSMLLAILTLLGSLTLLPVSAAQNEDNTDPTQPETLTAADAPADALAEVAADPPTEAPTDSPTEAPGEKAFPVINNVVPSANGVTVSWTAVEGASKYIVYAKKNDGDFEKLGDVCALSYEHCLTPNNTPYTYSVQAVDQNGDPIGDFDEDGFTFSCLPAPQLKGIENTVEGQKISWKSVGAKCLYRVCIKKKGGWYMIADTEKTSFTYSGVTDGKQYSYTVRCMGTDHKTILSVLNDKGLTATFHAAPKITSFTPGVGSITIKRNAVKGVSRYAFFVRKDGAWVKASVTDKAAYTHKNLTADTLYQYTVRCVDAKGKFISGFYPDYSFRYLAPVAISKVTASNGKPVLQIKKNPYIASYRIERKPFRNAWKTVATTSKTVYTDTAAKSGVPYTYGVTGLDTDGNRVTATKCNYIYYRNGAPANGSYTVGGTRFAFKSGKLVPGFYTIKKRQYWFNADSSFSKSGIVGSKAKGFTYADKNGVCVTSREIRLAAGYLMTKCSGKTLKDKMKTGFRKIVYDYDYERIYFDDPKSHASVGNYAIELFTRKRGTCYRYASGFACIARLCGYRVRFVNAVSSRVPCLTAGQRSCITASGASAIPTMSFRDSPSPRTMHT